jgi:hypothetical protein
MNETFRSLPGTIIVFRLPVKRGWAVSTDTENTAQNKFCGVGDPATLTSTVPLLTCTSAPMHEVVALPEKQQPDHKWLIQRMMRNLCGSGNVRAESSSTETTHTEANEAFGKGPVDISQSRPSDSAAFFQSVACRKRKALKDWKGLLYTAKYQCVRSIHNCPPLHGA